MKIFLAIYSINYLYFKKEKFTVDFLNIHLRKLQYEKQIEPKASK